MKKRSLFAAIAMLIVSAIVLTSATYAWFATGSASTTLGTIKGNVATAAAGVKLRVNLNNSQWVDTLDYLTLYNAGNNHFATNWVDGSNQPCNPDASGATAVLRSGTTNPYTYEPVSTDPSTHTNGVPDFYAYSMNGNVFADIDSSKTITEFYDVYTFYIGTVSGDVTSGDTDVNVQLNIGGTAAPAARVAVYYNDGSTWTYVGCYSGANESGWKPMVADIDPSTNGSYIDANSNFILDANDTVPTTGNPPAINSLIGSVVSTTPAGASNSATSFTIPACHVIGGYNYADHSSETTPLYNANQPNKLVRAYVWLEGQDSDCQPSARGIAGGDIQVTWTFTQAA